MNSLSETMQIQKIDHIKELLSIPCEERTEKMCLELMSFTKDLKLFENISMSVGHQKLCATMTLHHYKPNDIIVRQGDVGDSYYYILSGSVNVKIKIETQGTKGFSFEKSIKVLKAGEGFGELALLYGTPRSATIVSVTNTSFIRISKENFDLYLRDFLDNQLHDRIEFLKICPVFHKMNDQCSVDLGKNTEGKKYPSGEVIIKAGDKCEYIYIIRRGTVRVSKMIHFYKNANKVTREIKKKENNNLLLSYEDRKFRTELREEKIMQRLAQGPTKAEIENGESEVKDVTVETLRIGDIFPTYYSLNNYTLDVNFTSDNPCEVIAIKLSDLRNILTEINDFLQKYAKPYPSDEFLRKFYYYNDAWMNYRTAVKQNLLAEHLNLNLLKSNNMRKKLYPRKNMDKVRLPAIFKKREFL